MVLKSPHADVTIPDGPLSATTLAKADEFGDRPALIDGPSGRTITFAELAKAVKSLAAGLAGKGLKKGDVVGIFSPNLPEYAVAFHGIATAGGVVTTVNPTSTAEELSRQLQAGKARFLITAPPFLATANEAAKDAGVEEVFVFGEAEGATPFASLMGNPDDAPSIAIDPANDLVALPFSSGTTGLPKGVMLTHRNLVANVAQAKACLEVKPGSVAMGVLPFFHIYGMTVIMNLALSEGATIVTMPRFDLPQFLELHQKHGVTHSFVVPPIVLALAKHPLIDEFDLSTIEILMSGAAPLSPELAEAAAKRLGCVVLQGYGLTETSPVTHCNAPDTNVPGSVGQLIPQTEARIVDENGNDVAQGERGELWMRGPQIMKGYLDNPEATAAMVDADGWLHSGDVATVDEKGFFRIVDRLKELIKYKGFQVPPAELEAILLEHPQIADAAVIGRPDEEAGEIPVGFVVTDLDPEAVKKHVADHVSHYKQLRDVKIVESIPKSASGKILRRVLAEQDRA
ncbi:MAG: AMP-binding protein [Deltaproteobacteria bacterium]|nr:AMP-binding protein [Deltaproteobacteria bacterium]